MGLTKSDINGNFSHSFFKETEGMDIIDTDGNGRIITLATRGKTISEDGIEGHTDQQPPVTTATLMPGTPTGENGWYTSDVLISLSARDELSGVSKKSN